MSTLYHDGARRLQDHFDSRRIADRLEEVTLHTEFADWEKEWIESAPMFFLATAGPDGQPDVSYKGGIPGFVRVTGPSELAFPNYDGNGMFRSLGNVLANPKVALLFVNFEDPDRMRVLGEATVRTDDPLLPEFEGAQAVVRVAVTHIFPNCPRYVHRMQLVEHSTFAPCKGHAPPTPGWKQAPVFKPHLPRTPKAGPLG